mmetsp:Transcript_3641/g.8794  ORF Transcript_3641/g.8794 Transcript_3641/m.8794 type:complete len:132 (+) Transcript_3641:942-1337(+)
MVEVVQDQTVLQATDQTDVLEWGGHRPSKVEARAVLFHEILRLVLEAQQQENRREMVLVLPAVDDPEEEIDLIQFPVWILGKEIKEDLEKVVWEIKAETPLALMAVDETTILVQDQLVADSLVQATVIGIE